jgi:hypothetical protein
MSFFWRTGRQNRSCLGGWYQWEGEDVEENGKMRPVETMSGKGV